MIYESHLFPTVSPVQKDLFQKLRFKDLKIITEDEDGIIKNILIPLTLYRGESLKSRQIYIEEAFWTLNPFRALSYSLENEDPCILTKSIYVSPKTITKKFLNNLYGKSYQDASLDHLGMQRGNENCIAIQLIK